MTSFQPMNPAQAPANIHQQSAMAMQRETMTLKAFTRSGSGPKATFALVLASVTIATLSMSMDAVPRYSHDAFFVGLALTVILAASVGKVVDLLKGSKSLHLAAMLLLPTVCGAAIGMIVQALVLNEVGTSWANAVKDLGGLVDTTRPIPWILSGVVLGGLPALVVTVFLGLATRAIRKLTGHDASEGFGVAYTGCAGLAAGFGLVLVDGVAVPPLFIVTILAAIALLVALLVDGSRVRFLRKVYAGQGEGYDIVPADRFAQDPTLAPMVANAGTASVLVRVESRVGSYRAAAAEPIALVGENEADTLRPLLRRRIAASCMLVAMLMLAGLSALAHV